MHRLAVILVTLGLVVSGSAGTLAQSPSPSLDPPPWFSGPVELPEHGVAVNVPDGWIAFDPAGDVQEQARLAAMTLDPDAPEDEASAFADELLAARDAGGQLALVEDSGESACVAGVLPASEKDLGTFAEEFTSLLSSMEPFTDVVGPRGIEVAAGPGYLTTATIAEPADVEDHGPGAWMFIESAGAVLLVSCFGVERPGDDWLSIAETVEVLTDDG